MHVKFSYRIVRRNFYNLIPAVVSGSQRCPDGDDKRHKCLLRRFNSVVPFTAAQILVESPWMHRKRRLNAFRCFQGDYGRHTGRRVDYFLPTLPTRVRGVKSVDLVGLTVLSEVGQRVSEGDDSYIIVLQITKSTFC